VLNAIRTHLLDFALLRFLIGLKNKCYFLSQSEVETKSIATRSLTRSRALFWLHVFSSSFDWLTGLSVLLRLARVLTLFLVFLHSRVGKFRLTGCMTPFSEAPDEMKQSEKLKFSQDDAIKRIRNGKEILVSDLITFRREPDHVSEILQP